MYIDGGCDSGWARDMVQRIPNALLIGVWLVCVAAAWTGLLVHDRTPGPAATATTGKWPLNSSLHRVPGGPTLVMFAHPRCPCTRASLDELEKIVAQNRDRGLKAYVVFFSPDASDGAWLKSDITAKASKINGVSVITDPGGRETSVFGAVTSGDLRVYDGNGDLRYSGGITAERGHPGDNDGQRTVTAMLQGVSSKAPFYGARCGPVYGCRILPEQVANP